MTTTAQPTPTLNQSANSLTLPGQGFTVEIDPTTAKVVRLSTTHATWIKPGTSLRFAAPFLNGAQHAEVFVSLQAEAVAPNHITARSISGRTRLDLQADDDVLSVKLKLPRLSGPRAGLEMDLDLLDLATGTDTAAQVMPVVIYTADDCSYAYFMWHRADDQYVLMVVDQPFAAWRIKYSFSGHRMTGFQILAQADDVITRTGTRLLSLEELSVRVCFVDSIPAGLIKAAEILKVGMAHPRISGGIVGSRIRIDCLGPEGTLIHRKPDGSEKELAVTKRQTEIVLDTPGTHQIIARTGQREHVTRLLAHEQWETIYDRVNEFYLKYGQHECGAFYTAVHADSLLPDGLTYEGQAFGDPSRSNSCRAGEFGGFGGWAMIKNMLLFGEKPALRRAVDQYILNWGLNRGHEDKPFVDSICKFPYEHQGIQWSAYHIYKEINFMQAEAFFLKEFVDYYKLTGDKSVLDDAVGLAKHIITDHMRPDGCVTCQNSANREARDYTTVDAPGVAMVKLWQLLRDLKHPDTDHIGKAAEKIADYLVARGTACPTEGESCTEDGSMACTAWTLLNAYVFFKPKESYLRGGLQMLALHTKLEMKGVDCRMNHSTIRFWETQYETDSWGPSINAGHGWTIWTSMAKICAYLATDDIRFLRESYASFISCLSKIDKNGGMFCCYTPDMIPGMGHPWYGQHQIPEINADVTQSTTVLGWGYANAYAASGNHAIVHIAESWATMSGICADGTLINASLDRSGVLVSAAPKFDRLALETAPATPLQVAVEKGRTLTVTIADGTPITIDQADAPEWSAKRVVCRPTGNRITIRRS